MEIHLYHPPLKVGYIGILEGFKYLWQKLHEAGFKFLLPRNLNQDGLEFFFCTVRSHGIRNVNPTCSQFCCCYVSLIINNFMGTHSPGANCEDEGSEGALEDNLTAFITAPKLLADKEKMAVELQLPDCPLLEYESNNLIEKNVQTYIAGFVAKRILKHIGVCKVCRSQLLTDKQEIEEFLLIKNRAYSQRALLRPSSCFSKLLSKYSYNMQVYIEKYCIKNNLSGILKQIYDDIDFIHFTSKCHNIKELFQDFLTLF